METMGDRIRKLRVQKELTQVALCKSLNIKLTTYNTWERNISRPKHEKVLEIAEFFETSLDYLYGRTNSPYMTLEKTQMDWLIDEKILKLLGVPKKDVESLNRNDFDRILDYTRLIIQSNKYESEVLK
ncbi:helix-turn-helix domain-containing protein [Exiguobacterium artemiae]|uniref:helix-turn-helix domain-containing protein n=1 Tax=Exiguobacterium artemiae TaxID=340145 RepID=UPI003D02824B